MPNNTTAPNASVRIVFLASPADLQNLGAVRDGLAQASGDFFKNRADAIRFALAVAAGSAAR